MFNKVLHGPKIELINNSGTKCAINQSNIILYELRSIAAALIYFSLIIWIILFVLMGQIASIILTLILMNYNFLNLISWELKNIVGYKVKKINLILSFSYFY